jgi:MraZ protein
MFVSSFTNGLDAKGRVSIPASFRDWLGVNEVYLLPNLTAPCLDGGGKDYAEALMAAILSLPSYDPQRLAFEEWILPELRPLSIDVNGRVILPEDLISHGALSEKVLFVGRGNRFQLWAPEAFEAHRKASRPQAVDGLSKMHIPSPHQLMEARK